MKKLFYILLLFSLLGCTPTIESKPIPATGSKVEVEWVEVNPPPNTEGPCYAYFIIRNRKNNGATGYSGVWCK